MALVIVARSVEHLLHVIRKFETMHELGCRSTCISYFIYAHYGLFASAPVLAVVVLWPHVTVIVIIAARSIAQTASVLVELNIALSLLLYTRGPVNMISTPRSQQCLSSHPVGTHAGIGIKSTI